MTLQSILSVCLSLCTTQIIAPICKYYYIQHKSGKIYIITSKLYLLDMYTLIMLINLFQPLYITRLGYAIFKTTLNLQYVKYGQQNISISKDAFGPTNASSLYDFLLQRTS